MNANNQTPPVYDPTLFDRFHPPTTSVGPMVPTEYNALAQGYVPPVITTKVQQLAMWAVALLLDAGTDDREQPMTIAPPDRSKDPMVGAKLDTVWSLWKDPMLSLELLENLNALDALFTGADMRTVLASALWHKDPQDRDGSGWRLLWNHWNMGSMSVTLSFWTVVCKFSHIADFMVTTGVTLSVFSVYNIPHHAPIPCYGFSMVPNWWTVHKFTQHCPAFRLWLAQFAPYPMTAQAVEAGALDWNAVPTCRADAVAMCMTNPPMEPRVAFACGLLAQAMDTVHCHELWRSYDKRDGHHRLDACVSVDWWRALRHIPATAVEGSVTRFIAGVLRQHPTVPDDLVDHWTDLKVGLFSASLVGWDPTSVVHGQARLDLLRLTVNTTPQKHLAFLQALRRKGLQRWAGLLGLT